MERGASQVGSAKVHSGEVGAAKVGAVEINLLQARTILAIPPPPVPLADSSPSAPQQVVGFFSIHWLRPLKLKCRRAIATRGRRSIALSGGSVTGGRVAAGRFSARRIRIHAGNETNVDELGAINPVDW
jgi:hypothetical protein